MTWCGTSEGYTSGTIEGVESNVTSDLKGSSIITETIDLRLLNVTSGNGSIIFGNTIYTTNEFSDVEVTLKPALHYPNGSVSEAKPVVRSFGDIEFEEWGDGYFGIFYMDLSFMLVPALATATLLGWRGSRTK